MQKQELILNNVYEIEFEKYLVKGLLLSVDDDKILIKNALINIGNQVFYEEFLEIKKSFITSIKQQIS